jgi:hypothetical protein
MRISVQLAHVGDKRNQVRNGSQPAPANPFSHLKLAIQNDRLAP